jgi:hypothetical protein
MIEEVDREQSGPGKGRLSFEEFEHVKLSRRYLCVEQKLTVFFQSISFFFLNSCAPN